MIAVSGRVNTLDTLAAETESLMRLGARRYANRVVVVDALDASRAAQNRLRDRDRQIRVHVFFVAAEYLARLHPKCHVDLLFAHVETHCLTVFYSCWYWDVYFTILLRYS